MEAAHSTQFYQMAQKKKNKTDRKQKLQSDSSAITDGDFGDPLDESAFG